MARERAEMIRNAFSRRENLIRALHLARTHDTSVVTVGFSFLLQKHIFCMFFFQFSSININSKKSNCFEAVSVKCLPMIEIVTEKSYTVNKVNKSVGVSQEIFCTRRGKRIVSNCEVSLVSLIE